MGRSLKALKEKKNPPLAKVFFPDEKLSNEKGQSLEHLISKENTTKLKEKKIKDKQQNLNQI